MATFGILEMLGWYVFGFSTTVLILQIISKLDLRRGKEERMTYSGSKYTVLR